MAWEDIDESCTECGNVVKPAEGFNKQNLKRLCFTKPTLQEWATLFMVVMILLAVWRYGIEMKAYQDIIEDPSEVCSVYYENQRMEEGTAYREAIINEQLEENFKEFTDDYNIDNNII